MPHLRLYNTRTRSKADFVSLDPSCVRLYLCGPTVYDFAHIGNARPVIVFDVLFRLLSLLYPQVKYVRNVTDVDDKIIEAAARKNENITCLTQRTLDQYQKDMRALGALDPTIEPKATHHIGQMITMISTLIEKGFAYEAKGHVLFNVTQMADYGALSRRSVKEMMAGARVEIAPYKKNPGDFVLWKPSDGETVGWESPWGRGRPGWHIECSAMAAAYLGQQFDIHGGGVDLLFPHHENERAQSRCAFGIDFFAQYWVHNGMLLVNGEKMSKSLGNFLTVHDLLEKLPGEMIRYVLLSTHYRQPLNWTEKKIEESRSVLDKLYAALKTFSMPLAHMDYDELPSPLMDALLDDLNTPLALRYLQQLAGDVQKATDLQEKQEKQLLLYKSGRFLGFFQQASESWFQSGTPGASFVDKARIQELIQERIIARRNKDFQRADIIRTSLEKDGILLEDTPEGTTWRKA